MNIINIFDSINSTKSIEECLKITDEKNLIIIESLPWLLLRISEGNLSRLLHNWSSKIFTKYSKNKNKIFFIYRIKYGHRCNTIGLYRRKFYS